MFTDVPKFARDPKVAAASGLLLSVIAEYYFEDLSRWLAVREDEPEDWLRAAHFGDSLLYLTAEELDDLRGRVHDMVDGYVDRTAEPQLRPADARLVSFLHIAHPRIGPDAARGGDTSDRPG
jgi:hypothetical protein